MKNGLRAFMVCVDYVDLLAITLPYNVHHFSEVNIVTSYKDQKAVTDLVWNMPNPTGTGFNILATDLFWANGASFNKWLALEWALDSWGREGWMCLMDADVLWPLGVSVEEDKDGCLNFYNGVGLGKTRTKLPPGYLFTPLRRMFNDFGKARFTRETSSSASVPQPTPYPGDDLYPPESRWAKYPIHRNVAEWAGYTQVFHSSDPHLGRTPWHDTTWRHAGGADSFFQAKWPSSHKVRPYGWEVLHLGPAGLNWLGRSTTLANGTEHPQSRERQAAIGELWRNRRRREEIVQREGLKGEQARQQIFAPEKIRANRVDTYQEEG